MRGVGRTLVVLLVTVGMVLLLVLGALGVLAWGPSSEWQRLFVATFDETSALKFVPRLYLGSAAVEAILHPVVTDPNTGEPVTPFVELPYEDGTQSVDPFEEKPTQVVIGEQTDPTLPDGQWMEIVDIKGSTYKGKMMIIHDRSKVIVGTLDNYGSAYHGLYLYRRPGDAEDGFIEKYNAIGGTNAGGFYDPNGMGNGGEPEYGGLVMRDGRIVWGSTGGWYINVIGFDEDHILHVGDMSGQQALDLHLQSAVSFAAGPVLVKDGVLCKKADGAPLGGGFNPRTCIGQRADGTVLLMVIEGRKPDSMGATYDDIARIMFEYGAVNAANLDGGSSSLMYYNSEQITRGSNLIGMRQMATAILVLN